MATRFAALANRTALQDLVGERADRVCGRLEGARDQSFAYPFGVFNDRVVQAVRAAGFTMAYTTAAGTTENTDEPLTMPRVHIGRNVTPSSLLSILNGA